MSRIKRDRGQTIFNLGPMMIRTDAINRHEYNRLRKLQKIKLNDVFLALRKPKKKNGSS